MSKQWQVMAKWAAVVALGAAAAANAGGDQGRDQGSGRGSPGGPGAVYIAKATEACSGKQAGDEVTLTDPKGQSVDAVCTDRPAVLMAVPKARLERMEQARAACNGLSEGDAAVLSTPDGQNIAAHCATRHSLLWAVPNERPAKRQR